jgi:hypothetical protein
MGERMKDGIYLNLKNDKANLTLVTDGKFEDGGVVGVLDYDMKVDLDLETKTMFMVFTNLEYLGEL